MQLGTNASWCVEAVKGSSEDVLWHQTNVPGEILTPPHDLDNIAQLRVKRQESIKNNTPENQKSGTMSDFRAALFKILVEPSLLILC